MITNTFLEIYILLLSFINGLYTNNISSHIPADVNSDLTTLNTDIGDKINLIYNIIPANETLFTLIKLLFIIQVGLFLVRAGIFVVNIIRGSGAKA